MVGEDDDAVATRLEAYSCIDDETLCATNAQVWVEKDNGALVIIVVIEAVDGRHGAGRFVCE